MLYNISTNPQCASALHYLIIHSRWNKTDGLTYPVNGCPFASPLSWHAPHVWLFSCGLHLGPRSRKALTWEKEQRSATRLGVALKSNQSINQPINHASVAFFN